MRAIASFCFILLLAVVSCKQQPKIHKAFTSFSPSSNEYKRELARQISSSKAGDLIYTFNKYTRIAGKDYLDVSIKGNATDATALVLVNNWQKLENLKQTKGMGYSGAELKNLRLQITNPNAQPVFIYRGLDKIVD